MQEPIIRVRDIAWIRLQSPDLDQAEKYLTDFGMLVSERTGDALYMRGTDPSHHIHITELGPSKVLSVAFHADSEADLHRLTRHADGASEVEGINEPGGGKRVRLKEHNGYMIEVVHGVAPVEAVPVKRFRPQSTTSGRIYADCRRAIACQTHRSCRLQYARC